MDHQRAALRSSWMDWDGVELGTEGDSFFVVFDVARNAVQAALQAQRALHATSWPNGETVRVRMGLHTGEPTIHDGGYVGMDVHRAARVAAIAHGGQVVLTDATSHIVRDGLSADASLVDLGWHRLKDLATPEHLFQLNADGMTDNFAPLRSLGNSASLPPQSTTMIGRESELRELFDLANRPEVHLVTLTGPGGSGKTRLSVALAERLVGSFSDGVYFVALAGVSTADAMWTSIADATAATEQRSRSGVLEMMAHRTLLLVLDNLEQLMDADGVVAELLSGAPGVTIVATSRRPLHLRGEFEFAVTPLHLPSGTSLEAAATSAAVQLFCQHAEMVRSSFALTEDNANAVATICRRLDGLPLAIELTAARSKLLSPKAMLARLGSNAEVRADGVDRPTRQRSLDATIAWSYDLLDPHMQAFFRPLGVFPGSADLDAVEAVTSGGDTTLEDVESLVDVSLVAVADTSGGEPRINLLQTVRDFALARLVADGELEGVQLRHAEHYLDVAEALGPLLLTAQQLEVSDRLELEHDNLRAALTWALRPGAAEPPTREQVRVGVRLCAALWWFWASQGHVTAGRRWFDRAVEVANGEDSPEMARVLLGVGVWKTWESGEAEERAPWELEEALAMSQRWDDNRTMSEVALTLAQWQDNHEDADQAFELFERSLAWASEAGDDACRASALHHFAWHVFERGDIERAVTMVQEAYGISIRLGNERDALTRQRQLVDMKLESGDAEGARNALVELVPDVLRVRQPPLSIDVIGTFARDLLRVRRDPASRPADGGSEPPSPGDRLAQLGDR